MVAALQVSESLDWCCGRGTLVWWNFYVLWKAQRTEHNPSLHCQWLGIGPFKMALSLSPQWPGSCCPRPPHGAAQLLA